MLWGVPLCWWSLTLVFIGAGSLGSPHKTRSVSKILGSALQEDTGSILLKCIKITILSPSVAIFLVLNNYFMGVRAVSGHGEAGEPGAEGSVTAGRFNQESRSSGEFLIMRQVQGEAGKSICRSGSGLVRVTRVGHSPAGWPIVVGAVWGQAEESVHGSGEQTSGSMAKSSHGLECAADQHSCQIGAGRDCKLRPELKGSSWPCGETAQVEAIKVNKAC